MDKLIGINEHVLIKHNPYRQTSHRTETHNLCSPQ